MSNRTDPGFDPARDVLVDARNLRGLAHPMRLRMLSALREGGPATATQLAGRLGESSAATSYHLRQLADYGFIVEDAELGSGRERWWRAAHRYTHFELSGDEGDEVRVLGEEYLRAVVRAYAARMEAWVDALATTPDAWRDAGTMSDYRLHLTVEEAAALADELHAFARERGREAPRRGSMPVSLQFQVLPDHRAIAGARSDAAAEPEDAPAGDSQ